VAFGVRAAKGPSVSGQVTIITDENGRNRGAQRIGGSSPPVQAHQLDERADQIRAEATGRCVMFELSEGLSSRPGSAVRAIRRHRVVRVHDAERIVRMTTPPPPSTDEDDQFMGSGGDWRRRSLHRHEALQFFEPVLHDDNLIRRRGRPGGLRPAENGHEPAVPPDVMVQQRAGLHVQGKTRK
jgi:hypothetical protein